MESLRQSPITFADYQAWQGDERYEVIGGESFCMSSPTVLHQKLCANLSLALGIHFRGSPCDLFFAPLDVRLSDIDVVQPDLLVVCNSDQLKSNYVDGPPSLVIEVTSPSSLRHDRVRKFRLYAAYGVKEYWIFTPSPSMAEVHVLDDQGYRTHGVYSEKDTLLSPSFPELKLELESVFPPVEIDEVHEVPPPYATKATPAGRPCD